MWKSNKILVSIVIAFTIYVIVGQIVIPLIKAELKEYEFVDNFDERYYWMFQDSVSKKLNTFYSIGNEERAVYGYKYDNKYRFIIWEFKELNSINLSNIRVNENIEIRKQEFSPILQIDLGPFPMINILLRMYIDEIINIAINIDLGGSISNIIKEDNYNCYYGFVRKFGIVNEVGDYQIVISYDDVKKTMLVETYVIMYKNKNSFFLIIVNPIGKNKIDKNIFNLLKL